MSASRWRRWALPVYVVLLALWVAAIAVDFVVFDGPTSPVQWLQIVVVAIMLAVLIAAELKARREAG